MKRVLGALMVLVATVATAQPIQVQVILRTPAPGALPVWAEDPTIVQITLRNTSPTLYDGAIVSFAIRRLPQGTVVARSKDFHPLQPRFTIPPNGSLVLTGPQIIHESAIRFEDETLRQQAQVTGQLPEGEYEFCVRVLDAGGTEIGSTGAFCPRTVVLLPDPPMLIHPRNDSTLAASAMPMFIWAPVTGSLVPVTYTLKVAPLFPGQSPLDALERNAPVLNISGLRVPLYQYVPTDIPFGAFPTAIGFVWQVSAVDALGNPATRNNGKSEIFRFRVASTGMRSGADTSTPGRQTDTLRLTGAPTLPGDTGGVVRRIELPGGFVLIVRGSLACSTSTCVLSGSGTLYIPLLGDSVTVSFSGITVTRPTASGTSSLVGGTITVPLDAYRTFGLLTLRLRQLIVTSTAATLDGTWIARWSQWGWGCRTADSVQFSGIPCSVGGIAPRTMPIAVPWTCDGNGLMVGPCIELRFDTLDVQVAVDTTQRPPQVTPSLFAAGRATFPCLVSSGAPVEAAFRVRLDRGKSDLLAALYVRVRDARVLGMGALRVDADQFVLDLSDQVNPSGFPPSGLCSNPGWSDLRWRGVFAPNLRARLTIGDDTLHITTDVILDQGSGLCLRPSLAATVSGTDTLHVGGFAVRVESVTAQLCQGTLQSITANGTIIMPASLQLPRSWGALDSVTVRLSAYDDGSQWRWGGQLTIHGGLRLPFGSLAVLELRDGTLEVLDHQQGSRRGYIEFTHLRLHAPATNPTGTADFYGLRIWNTGEIELEIAEGWMDISRWARLSVANLTIQAQEVGLGYGARGSSEPHWWVGFSGGMELDAGSGLPGGGNGFRVRRLRIWDDGALTSEGAYVSASISGAFRLSGTLGWGDQTIAGVPVRGLLGRLNGEFPCLGGLQSQVDFALGSTDGTDPYRFWFVQGAAAVPGGVPIVPGAFHLVGGLLGAGWHVRLDGYDASLIRESGLTSPPNVVPDRGVDLLLRGGLIFADPTLQLYRLTAATSLAFGSSTQVDIDGSIAILPPIRFATGTAWAQYLHSHASRSVSVGGAVSVNFLSTPLFGTSMSATFRSGGSSCLQLGPFSREWIVADMDEDFGSDLLGVKVIAKGYVGIGNLYARFCPTQGELYGSISGAIVGGANLTVGAVQLPHHVGLGIGSDFCARYYYRFWRTGSTFHLTARAGGALDVSANFDYSGYPYGHYTQAYDHVRGRAYNGGPFVDLGRHWRHCGGEHCKSSSLSIRLRGLFQVDASIGALPVQVGSTTVYVPQLSSARIDPRAGYYVRGDVGKTFEKVGGSLGIDAQALSCSNLENWGSSAGRDNANQIQPPPLVQSSTPARGDTGVPVTACIQVRTGARLWAFPGSSGGTRLWKVSTLNASLQQLTEGGDVVREVPLAQRPGSPPIDGSDTVLFCVNAAFSAYPWHVLLPGTRYRLVLSGTLESSDRQTHTARDTVEFRTTRRTTGLELRALCGRGGAEPLPPTLTTSLDTLVVRYPVGTEGNRVAPLEFGRDLWLEIETPTQTWRWTGRPNALVRETLEQRFFGAYIGTEFRLDTSLLQPPIIPLRPPRILPLPITIRVLNAAAHGHTVARPAEAAAWLAALPAEVARFTTMFAPSAFVETGLATSIQWNGSPLPVRAGVAGETSEPTSPVNLTIGLRNTGSSGIYPGTPFQLRVGAYVRLPNNTRQFIVEEQDWRLPQHMPPAGVHQVRYQLQLPTGSEVIGIDVSLIPKPPFTERDGTANNRLQMGILPPQADQSEQGR